MVRITFLSPRRLHMILRILLTIIGHHAIVGKSLYFRVENSAVSLQFAGLEHLAEAAVLEFAVVGQGDGFGADEIDTAKPEAEATLKTLDNLDGGIIPYGVGGCLVASDFGEDGDLFAFKTAAFQADGG